MQTFYSLLLLLLASSCTAYELREIGIRVVVNHGVADERCSEADQENLKSIMQTSQQQRRLRNGSVVTASSSGHQRQRRLRNSAARRRLQAMCSDLCTDMTSGNCFVMHPQCQGLEELDDDAGYDDDDLGDSDVPIMEPEFTFEEEEEDEMPTCNGKLTQAKTQLKEVFRSESVSQTCKDLVKSSIHLECVVFDHDH